LNVGNFCAGKGEEEEHGSADKLAKTGDKVVLEI
jgi:hypothetical protein